MGNRTKYRRDYAELWVRSFLAVFTKESDDCDATWEESVEYAESLADQCVDCAVERFERECENY